MDPYIVFVFALFIFYSVLGYVIIHAARRVYKRLHQKRTLNEAQRLLASLRRPEP